MDHNALYWIWLSQRPRIGAKGQRELLGRFGTPAELYEADAEALARAGLSPSLQRSLLDKNLAPARAVLERCRQSGVRALCLAEADYPARLRLQEDAPILLYCKGRLPAEGRPVIALVGAREADDAGQRLAFRLGAEIGACGGMVCTGMAKGIDARSAQGALEAGAPVIGVLGCGPDLVYPRENAALFARVAEQGCLISEYPPGTSPNARHFPVRNRLISALSDGVAVVRAAEHSGSLITARWALEQGREVYAVPGDPADPLSRGCNALLREGAIAAESGWDLLRRYEFRYPGVVRRQDVESQIKDQTTLPCLKGTTVRGTVAGFNAGAAAALTQPATMQQGTALQGGGGIAPMTGPSRGVDCSALSPIQRQIVEALTEGPMQLDALIDKTGLPAAQVLPQLTLLQIKHTITQRPGKRYELSGG